MLRIRKQSKWRFETSAGVSGGASFIVAVGAGKASFFAEAPEGGLVQFHYASAGAGVGIGAKAGISASETQYLSVGRIYILEAFAGAELSRSDLTGPCMFIEASGGIINGGAATAMLLGIPPQVAKIQDQAALLLLELGAGVSGGAGGANVMVMLEKRFPSLRDTAKALLIMGGLNVGAQVGGSLIGGLGYVWTGAPSNNTRDIIVDIPSTENAKVRISNTGKERVLIIPGDVLFDFDKDTIGTKKNPAQAVKFLNEVGGMIKSNAGSRVRIEGHTDSIGDDNYNMGLSLRRATNVGQWLVLNRYVDGSKVSWRGWGKSRPAESNSNPQGRAQNRRVVIYVE